VYKRQGLQGAQLPPIDATGADGLRAYPDQPLINNLSGDQGVTGIRIDSLALVAVNDGVYELPALEIPWWDTQSNSLKIATLPAQQLTVLPTPGSLTRIDQDPTATVTPADGMLSPDVARITSPTNGAWPWIAGICALGWIITSVLWWRRAKRLPPKQMPTQTTAISPPKLFEACKQNNPSLARAALRAWLLEQGHGGSIEMWLREQNIEALSNAVADLERCLYQSDDDNGWDGKALSDAIKSLAKAPTDRTAPSALPPLYLN